MLKNIIFLTFIKRTHFAIIVIFGFMTRWIAIALLSIFTTCNLVIIYGGYQKGMKMSVAMIEEEETHLEILEVKKYLKCELNPFEWYVITEPQSISKCYIPVKDYEDVLLNSIETPPDFMC